MEAALGAIYILVLVVTIGSLLLKPRWFLFLFLCLMGLSPTAQYLVYEGTGDNYFTTTYQRLILEFINIFLLLFYIGYHKINLQKIGKNNILICILFFWNILHFSNILTSIDINRSIIFYLISVLGPTVFLYYIVFSNSISLDSARLTRIIYLFSTFFYSLGIIFVVYRAQKFGYYSPEMRRAGSIYMSNFSINLMALFVPLIFISHKEKGLNILLKLIFIVGVVINHVLAVSRLGMVIYLLLYLYLSINSISSFFRSILVLGLLATLSYLIVLEYLDFDMIEFITFRFIGYENSFSENTANDERFRIWGETINHIVNEPLIGLTGIGISNYRIADPDVLKYSNAHNLLLNVFFERGVGLLIVLLSIIAYYIYTFESLKKKKRFFVNKEFYLIKSLGYGGYLFLVIEFFYNDLFTASGQQSGLFAYMFFFNFGILLKYKLSLRNRK